MSYICGKKTNYYKTVVTSDRYLVEIRTRMAKATFSKMNLKYTLINKMSFAVRTSVGRGGAIYILYG